jgi:hypothetical protein
LVRAFRGEIDRVGSMADDRYAEQVVSQLIEAAAAYAALWLLKPPAGEVPPADRWAEVAEGVAAQIRESVTKQLKGVIHVVRDNDRDRRPGRPRPASRPAGRRDGH